MMMVEVVILMTMVVMLEMMVMMFTSKELIQIAVALCEKVQQTSVGSIFKLFNFKIVLAS